jgi:tRNA threonylcarbamoyladenosine biosynthesis protein TsaE
MTAARQHAAMPYDHGQTSDSPGVRPVTHHLDIPGEAALARLAEHLAEATEAGDALLLIGDLGAGKTTFARYFIRARGIEDDVPSPTFSLVQAYDGPDGAGPTIWHFDLYRLEGERDLLELGLEDALAGGITLIEWPDRMGRLSPTDRLEIKFDFGGAEGAREVTLQGYGAWAEKLTKLFGTDHDGD